MSDRSPEQQERAEAVQQWCRFVRGGVSAGPGHPRLATQLEIVDEIDALLAEKEWLEGALREDPGKWSFWTLVEISRLILKSNYPADVFDGSSDDSGPVFVVKLREALAALAPSVDAATEEQT